MASLDAVRYGPLRRGRFGVDAFVPVRCGVVRCGAAGWARDGSVR